MLASIPSIKWFYTSHNTKLTIEEIKYVQHINQNVVFWNSLRQLKVNYKHYQNLIVISHPFTTSYICAYRHSKNYSCNILLWITFPIQLHTFMHEVHSITYELSLTTLPQKKDLFLINFIIYTLRSYIDILIS